MAKDTADIVGSMGSQFRVTISPDDPAGTTAVIKKVTLKKAGQLARDHFFRARNDTGRPQQIWSRVIH